MVGSPLIAECTVSTVDGVELNDVMINWTGPGVLTDRFIMNSVISNGNNTYSRTLQLTHLIQSDENSTYICIAMILEANSMESLELESLTGKQTSLLVYILHIIIVNNYIHTLQSLCRNNKFINFKLQGCSVKLLRGGGL